MSSRTFRVVVAVAVVLPPTAEAQTMSADEKAIREIIANADAGQPIEQTSNSIAFSGALRRPVVRGEGPAEPRPEVQNRVPGTQRAKSTVRRIEISSSGDLAYVFADATVTNQVKGADGQVRAELFNNSSLRVFKKVDGKWLMAAVVASPHPR